MCQNRILLSVKDFDDAVKKMVDLLHESDTDEEGNIKAISFGGWKFQSVEETAILEGLGAYAVLGAIAKLIKSKTVDDSDTSKNFDRVAHVDCSMWKNRRTLQRTIAEELSLLHVMPIFDKHDEEDDLKGVDDNSRKEIASIGTLINMSLRDERFLMIFHYGGFEDIDLVECGIPLFGKGKLLWTNDGRFFRIKPGEVRLIRIVANNCIYMTINPATSDTTLHRILHEEAIRVIGATGMDGINPKTVLECFFYSLFLNAQLPKKTVGVGYGWDTHACNYWICDGILQGGRAWEIGNALHGLIPWFSSLEAKKLAIRLDGRSGGWYSVTSNEQGAADISNVPSSASSYFLTFQEDDPVQLPHLQQLLLQQYQLLELLEYNKWQLQQQQQYEDWYSQLNMNILKPINEVERKLHPVNVRNDLFQLASNLRVLKLCNCSFDFSTPPFRCCRNLRFLWLDHCANTGDEKSGGLIFPNLLVFDLRFTDFVFLPHMVELMTNLRELNMKGVSWKTMSHAWIKLQKLQKLRVTKSSDVVRLDSYSSIDMVNLELLDLSGNTHMDTLSMLSSARSLKVLVLDGCSSLEHVALAMERAPPQLESFSFDGYGPAENWTHSIDLPQKELRLNFPVAPIEMVQVTKISLQGCGRLQNIFLRALHNLEELDLSNTAIKILDLRAMDVPNLKKLFLLGCQKLRSLFWDVGSPRLEVLHVDTLREARSVVCCGEQAGSFGLHAFIAFTDGRFTWSPMAGLYDRVSSCLSKVYILISCMSHIQANITKSIKEIGSSQEASVPTRPLLPYNDIAFAKDVTCPSLVWNQQQLQTLDVHIEIGEGSYNLEGMLNNASFRSFADYVQSLHVHDNSSITVISPAGGAYWERLEWCHVERCPKIHSVFSCQDVQHNFLHIRIFSASDLPVAYCIWGRGTNIQGSSNCFQQLQHIYLYNCPRLVFVLPISFTLPNLETLHIAYCSSLRHIFPLDDKHPPAISSGVTFRNLKQIKLYHLHNLEQICEARLTASTLQTIGIRDCWALRRLPAVAGQIPKPVVDCEKDWWNKLEWDGLDAGHHPSLFETRHSDYYKKMLPRVSFLR